MNMAAADILIVDDNPDIRQLLRMTIEAPGVRLREAASGAEALDLIERQRPSLVILDVMMAGEIDGLAVCRRIRADPRSARVPVIVLSARGQKADVEEGLKAGANAYIVKPFSPFALQEAIAGLLTGRSE